MKIKVKRVRAEATIPTYMSKEAAGVDLYACLDGPFTLSAGDWALIPTGIALGLPDGYELQIRPRSGLALYHGVTILNSPGTVDADYRGEIKVMIINLGKEPFTIHHGDRIAQAILSKVEHIEWIEVRELVSTPRGEGGFGHTGN